MKHSLLRAFVLVICWSCLVNGQSSPEIWYFVPLHNAKDPTGRAVSEGIDAELSKMAMEKRLGVLKKISYEKDTCFRRYFEQDSFSRDLGGFLDPLSLQPLLHRLHVPETKLLLVYDVTAEQEFSTWKPPAIITPSVLMDNLFAGKVNSYDSLWCKISFIDFEDPSHSSHRRIIANGETCHGDPVACIVETIQSIGRDPGARSGKPTIQLTGTPREQHVGKIVGGSILIAGGIGLCVLTGFTNPDLRGIGYFGSGAVIFTGTAFLTIGIHKQIKYHRSL